VSSAVRLVVGGTLAGLFAAATITAYRGAAQSQPILPSPFSDPGQDVSKADLHRCLTITMPDGGCNAVWQAEHDRFFGGASPVPAPPRAPVPHQDEVQP
jgi:conjugative transfer region protein TrbK